MSKQEILQAAYDAIQECGWMPDGIAATECPWSRGKRKENVRGRQRFRKLDWFCTIGPKTTNFYQRIGDIRDSMIQVPTSDVEGIRKLANEKGK